MIYREKDMQKLNMDNIMLARIRDIVMEKPKKKNNCGCKFIVSFKRPVAKKDSDHRYVQDIIYYVDSIEEVIEALDEEFDFTDVLDDIYWHTVYEQLNNWRHKSWVTAEKPLPEDYVFDMDKSVRWNREQVQTHNAAIIEAQEKLTAEKESTLQAIIKNANAFLQNMALFDFDISISAMQADALWQYGLKNLYDYTECTWQSIDSGDDLAQLEHIVEELLPTITAFVKKEHLDDTVR